MQYDIKMPKLSPTMEEGIIVRWLVKEGDFIEADAPLLEMTTDKATVEHPTLDAGWVRKIYIPAGEKAPVGGLIAILTDTADEPFNASIEITPSTADREEIPPKKFSSPVKDTANTATTRVKASPLAKKVASQRGISLENIRGTGPRGRIMLRDLEGETKQSSSALQNSGGREEKLSPISQIVANRLKSAKQEIPHFYLFIECDADLLVEERKGLKEKGLKITYNDMVIKALALALKEHPEMNLHFDSARETKIFLDSIDIAVAVDITDGLITPIIKKANEKSLEEISLEMKELAERARKNQLKSEEFSGGSCSLSNLGSLGITHFSAIINPPQTFIVSVGGIQEKVRMKNGTLTVGFSLNIGMSCDHRVVSGTPAAHFLNTLKKIIENPFELLL